MKSKIASQFVHNEEVPVTFDDIDGIKIRFIRLKIEARESDKFSFGDLNRELQYIQYVGQIS